ncbi:MAG: hypothetical protein EON59_05845 [Alphaproteobacteria bacterium]|nr:MAG: hypothetical protein EON59_05845 [Alphaproteobacteria bacterium]
MKSPEDPFAASWRQRSALAFTAEAEYKGEGLDARHLAVGRKCPHLVASLNDPTASYFFGVNVRSGRDVAWIAPEDILSGGLHCNAALDALDRASGLYFREWPEATADYSILGCVVRARVARHSNVVAPPATSTNWSKPLHVLFLAERLREHAVAFPRTRLAMGALASSEEVLKGCGALPSFVYRPGVNTPHDRPLILQRYINGYELRIHVIGSDVFVHRLDRCGLDYRRDGLRSVSAGDISHQERSACIKAAAEEGLRFAGLDVLRADGTSYLLEVNPMPGYHCFEEAAGVGTPITDAIYSALCAEVAVA